MKIIKKLLKIIILMIWILDIVNCSFMKFMDTTIPINKLGWFLIFSVIYPLLFDEKDFK